MHLLGSTLWQGEQQLLVNLLANAGAGQWFSFHSCVRGRQLGMRHPSSKATSAVDTAVGAPAVSTC
jgi:hypothetical protein